MGICLFFQELTEHVVSSGPSGRLFSTMRYRHYRKRMVPGSGPFGSLTGLSISCPKNVFIGKHVSINRFVTISACHGGEIRIGDNCLIGPYVLIRSADHRFEDPAVPIRTQGHNPGPISIGDDCWIAGHVTITRGVTIGKGCVIGANSVVTRDIPEYSVAAGNPARVIGSRRTGNGAPPGPAEGRGGA